MRLNDINRDSKFYHLKSIGQAIHVDLHPNKTTGGFFLVLNAAEAQALIERLEVVRDTLAEAEQSRDENVPILPESEGEGI